MFSIAADNGGHSINHHYFYYYEYYPCDKISVLSSDMKPSPGGWKQALTKDLSQERLYRTMKKLPIWL